ncbi:hypothetical protein AKO1_007073 [Acrasis kona]|uniref:Fe2OG dioxygenase domain-containing protein n=1 Tax=Acrasis kona TaxID=1008807 RepID=A0AAW2YU91_9EUKA
MKRSVNEISTQDVEIVGEKDITTFLDNEVMQTEFCVEGSSDISQPNLKIDGKTELKIPLNNNMVDTLIKLSSVAPVGVGSETVVDPTIRKGYDIDASRIKREMNYTSSQREKNIWVDLFSGSCYGGKLDEMFKQEFARSTVHIKPYKLLVYEQGQFFKPHRDTQRDKHQFASIVLFLPGVSYTGGDFIIRHMGKEKVYNFQDPNKLHYICFYTDCEHEITPIISGRRVTMTFNVFCNKEFIPRVPVTENDLAIKFHNLVMSVLRSSDRPIGFLLNHRYSLATMSPDKLKGKDLLIYQMLATRTAERKLWRFSGIKKKINNDKSIDEIDPNKYHTKTIPELKELLKPRGLKVGGKKFELIARLLLDDEQKKPKGSTSAQDSTKEAGSNEEEDLGKSSQPVIPTLPLSFDVSIIPVEISADGQGGVTDRGPTEGPEYYLELGFEGGVEFKVKSGSNEIACATYANYPLANIKQKSGSVSIVYGFEGLLEIPTSKKKLMPTGNCGIEFALQYTHAMMIVKSSPDQAAVENPSKIQKIG